MNIPKERMRLYQYIPKLIDILGSPHPLSPVMPRPLSKSAKAPSLPTFLGLNPNIDMISILNIALDEPSTDGERIKQFGLLQLGHV